MMAISEVFQILSESEANKDHEQLSSAESNQMDQGLLEPVVGTT